MPINPTTQNKPPSGIALKLDRILKGCQTVLPSSSSITLDNVAVSQAQLLQDLERVLAPFLAVRAEKTAYLAVVKAKDDAVPAAQEYLAALRGGLIAAFGRKNPLLSGFGINPSKTRILTSEQKVIAAAKRLVTRKKRGTLGPRQKLAIKALGVPSVTVNGGGMKVTPSPFDAKSGEGAGGAAPEVPGTPPPLQRINL